MLLIANPIPCQVDRTLQSISMSMYEIGKFIVYMFTVYTLYSLQQIFYFIFFVSNLSKYRVARSQ